MSMDRFRRCQTDDELKHLIAVEIRDAITEERRELKATLQLAQLVMDEVLLLPGIPDELRMSARVCRGLCLEGLQEETEIVRGGDGETGS